MSRVTRRIIWLAVLLIAGFISMVVLSDDSTPTPTALPDSPTYSSASQSPTLPVPTINLSPTYDSADLSPTAPAPMTQFSPTYHSASLSPTVTPIPSLRTSTPNMNFAYAQLSVGLNVRSGPGTDYAIIGALPAGSTPEILALDETELWLRVRFDHADGWIWRQLVVVAGDVSHLPRQAVPSVTPPQPSPTITPFYTNTLAPGPFPTPTLGYPATATPVRLSPQQPLGLVEVVLVPALPASSYTEDAIPISAQRMTRRLIELGITPMLVDPQEDAILLRFEDNGYLDQILPALEQRGLLEVVDFRMLSLEHRNAIIGQQVMTDILANNIGFWMRRAVGQESPIPFATQFPASIYQAHAQFNPLTGQPFASILWTSDPSMVVDVGIHYTGIDWTATIKLRDGHEDFLREYTASLVGHFAGIALDGTVLDAPLLDAPLADISIGGLTEWEAHRIRAMAISAALHIPFRVEILRTIPPTLFPTSTPGSIPTVTPTPT